MSIQFWGCCFGPKGTQTTWMMNSRCTREATTRKYAWLKIIQLDADFSQIMQPRNQLVIAAENFGSEENMSLVLIPTLSKDMDDQLKLVHKTADVVDCPYRKICVTLLPYKVDKPQRSFFSSPSICRED